MHQGSTTDPAVGVNRVTGRKEGSPAQSGGNEPPAKTLLLVEDDRLVLATALEVLTGMGYRVYPADTGEAAVEGILSDERISIDLAILDVRLPGISGLDLAERLLREHGIPSLFLSAYFDRAQVEEAIARGGVGYAVKPIEPAHLVPAIEAALARAKDLRALTELSEQLQQALTADRETDIAIGILMTTRHLDRRAAFETLRDDARSRRMKVGDLAHELVAQFERGERREQ